MSWKERWNPPGRDQDGAIKSELYRDTIRMAEGSAALPMMETAAGLCEITKELLILGKSARDYEAIVRAYEIAHRLTDRINLPVQTWAIVKVYADTSRQVDSIGFAFTTEAQCRALAAVEHAYCEARALKNGWRVDRYEARQVDNARPHMLIRPEITEEVFREWLVRTLA